MIVFILSVVSMILALKSFWKILLLSKKIDDMIRKKKARKNRKSGNEWTGVFLTTENNPRAIRG
jgi:hypothetical protein